MSPVRKKFAQNLLFALAANALVKPAYILLIDRAVQVRAGSEAYGRYAALFNLATIFGVVLDFGLSQYATRQLSATPAAIHSSLGPLLRARLLLCIVYAAAVFVAAGVLGFSAHHLQLLAGILVVQALAQMLLFLRACTASLQRFKTDAVLSVLDRALLLCGMGALLLLVARRGAFWVDWFVVAQITGYTTAVVAAAVVLRRAMAHVAREYTTANGAMAAVRGSLPYAAMVFGMTVYTRVDMLLLERLHSAAEAGRYAAAFRLLDIGNMMSLVVAGILLPLFGRMLAERSGVGSVVRASAIVLLPPSIAVAAVAVVQGGPILDALYPNLNLHAPGSSGAGSGVVLGLLMLAFPAMCLSAIYSTLLTATGRIMDLVRIALAGCLLNLALNFLLIPHSGASGAAIAAAITQWTVAILFTIFATRRVGLRWNAGWISSHAAVVVITGTCTFMVGGVIHCPWWITAVGAAFFAVGSALALRLVSVTEIRRLLQR